MAKVSYKKLYEDCLLEIETLKGEISNLKSKLSQNETKPNKLTGLVFRNGKFWKNGINYNSVNDYLIRDKN